MPTNPPARRQPPGPLHQRLVSASLAIYVVLAGSTRALPLPVKSTAQAGDLAAAALAALAVWSALAMRPRPGIAATDRAVAAWMVALTLACVAGVLRGTITSRGALVEALGAVSLVAVYASIRVTSAAALLTTALHALVWMATIAVACGIAGVALDVAGVPTALVRPSTTPYPYLGTAVRAQGFLPSPGMLCSVAITGLGAWAVLWARDGAAWRRRWWLALLIGAGPALAVSKSVLCLVSAVGAGVATWPTARRSVRWVSALLAIVVAVAYIASAHLTLTETHAVDRLVAGRFIAGPPLATVDAGPSSLGVYRTNYWFNKAATWSAIRETWPLGLGPGGQNAYTAKLMQAGGYPATMWAADPHSTYLGAASELGLAGTAALFTLGLAVLADGRRLWRRWDERAPWLARLLAMAIVYVGLEAVTADVMNYRHYWVVLALMATAAAQARR